MNALKPIPHSNTLPEGFTLLAVPPMESNSPARMFESFPEVMTCAQASKALNCCSKTLRETARRGEIEHFRIGNNYRFTKSALIAFVEGGALDA